MKDSIPYVDIHTHLPSKSSDILSFQTHSEGIHPYQINQVNIEEELKKLLSSKKPFIGEIGIDLSIDTDIELQKKVFTKQLVIAKKLNRPVIIHAVRSHSIICEILIREKFSETFLIHGFVGNTIEVLNYVKLGGMISFGAKITTSPKTKSAMMTMPRKNILLETDNQENYSIEDIYKFASSILEVGIDDLKELMYKNFKAHFGVLHEKLD